MHVAAETASRYAKQRQSPPIFDPHWALRPQTLLLLALVFGGLGFVYPILWIVAVVLFVGWIFGVARSRGHARAT